MKKALLQYRLPWWWGVGSSTLEALEKRGLIEWREGYRLTIKGYDILDEMK